MSEAQGPINQSGHRWLVTGAAGFIGSHLVEALLRRGDQVVGLDSFATGRQANIDDVLAQLPDEAAPRLDFIEGDIRDLDTCRRAADGCTHVLHQAAVGSVARSVADPLTTDAVNVAGTLNVLTAARDGGASRFVYASTSAVYGDAEAYIRREGEEGEPLSPYAAGKRANELYAAAFAHAYGMHVVGLRYFNVYGPRQDPAGEYAAVIPRWIDQLLAGERCVVFGDGETSRDFIHVADVVAANLAAATADGVPPGSVVNIAYGRRTTLNELYAMLRSAAADFRPDVADQRPDYQPFRVGDVRHSAADTSLAEALLGYRPQIEPDRGLRETVEWFAQRR